MGLARGGGEKVGERVVGGGGRSVERSLSGFFFFQKRTREM